MKFSALVLSWLSGPLRERNLRPFFFLTGLFASMVAIYSVLFHVIMGWEGQDYSWITSVYWTVVTMSTLGYGDIVFRSGLGQIFSMVVLLSGSSIILVLLPFTFIQFVFTPWMQRRDEQRTPRKVEESVSGHMILARLGAVEEALIERAETVGVPYVIIEPSPLEAGLIHDRGYSVMVGDFDSPETYRSAGVDRAAVVVTTHPDPTNANIAFTVREVSPVKVVASATSEDAVDVLELSGADTVFQLGDLLGEAFANRLLSPSGAAHVVYRRGGMCVAEATIASPELVGMSMRDSGMRASTGCSFAGVWDHGELKPVTPDTKLALGDLVIVVGGEKQVKKFNKRYSLRANREGGKEDFVVIIGCGRVGRALSDRLSKAGLPHSVVDSSATGIAKLGDSNVKTVCGDASDIDVLKEAGIEKASAVVVTTHDDNINIYLTLYVRRLIQDVELLSRAHMPRNISTLYRAGADMVLSYGSMGSDFVWRSFRAEDKILLAEGLEVFRVITPEKWSGREVHEVDVFSSTGCMIAGREAGDGSINPLDSLSVLTAGEALWMVGDSRSFHRD